MKPDEELESAEIARAVASIFGDRLERARLYRELLITDGIDHGLIGPREIDRIWMRHILNCAVVAQALSSPARVVDIGSGAGLPGIPLALAAPHLSVTLVEPLERRYDFLHRAVDQLDIAVTVVRGRADDPEVVNSSGGADVVTSRAVAPLDRLARWSSPLIAEAGSLVAIKGSSAQQEIDKHSDAVRKAGITDLTVTTVGADILSVPTTLVCGTRVFTAAERKRAQRRR